MSVVWQSLLTIIQLFAYHTLYSIINLQIPSCRHYRRFDSKTCMTSTVKIKYTGSLVCFFLRYKGALAQLARALALQAWGHRFESDMLHQRKNKGG